MVIPLCGTGTPEQPKNLSEFSKVWNFHAFLARAKQSRWTLKKFLSNEEVVNIKYPEKIFTISFISQYFAFNECGLAFPRTLQEDILIT